MFRVEMFKITCPHCCAHVHCDIRNFSIFFPAREDYISISEIVEFSPGQTERHISLQINDDMRIEDNETLQLYLIAGAGVNLTPHPRMEVTIQNDDGELNSTQMNKTQTIARHRQLHSLPSS